MSGDRHDIRVVKSKLKNARSSLTETLNSSSGVEPDQQPVTARTGKARHSLTGDESDFKTRRGSTVARWFKHITDAAEAYKGKDGGRGRKQSAPTDASLSSGGSALDISASSPDVTSPTLPHDDVGLDHKTSGSVESLDAVSQGVEVLHIEPLRLVQPNEVVVSSTVCMEKPNPVLSPYELMIEKTEQIKHLMDDKKALVAEVLRIPVHEYDTITEVVSEVKDSTDARELLLGSIMQADSLTRVINERITAEHVQRRTTEDSGTSWQNVGGFPVVVSGVQLLSISTRLHHNLSRLTEVLIRKLQESERLKCELSELQNRLQAATSTMAQGDSDAVVVADCEDLRPTKGTETTHNASSSPPYSCVVVTSPTSDSLDDAMMSTVEPAIFEQLEVVEVMLEPTVIDASQVVIVANDQLTASEHAIES